MATSRRRRWWWLAGAVVVVVVVTAVVIARFVVYRDTSTALAPNTALNRYRSSTTLAMTTESAAASTTPGSAAAIRLPSPGVYRYATTGQEHVDALGGTTHTYPPTTTITITPDGCGVQARWDVLQERWMSRQMCLGTGGIVTDSYTDFHRFYGQDDSQTWSCQPPYVLVPPVQAATTGASWTGGCVDGTDQEDTTIAMMGRESVTVGGQTVDAVHLQRVEKDHDKNSSALSTTDQWFDPSDGLVLRETESSTSTTPSLVGAVHYDEHYELQLESLSPQQ